MYIAILKIIKKQIKIGEHVCVNTKRGNQIDLGRRQFDIGLFYYYFGPHAGLGLTNFQKFVFFVYFFCVDIQVLTVICFFFLGKYSTVICLISTCSTTMQIEKDMHKHNSAVLVLLE